MYIPFIDHCSFKSIPHNRCGSSSPISHDVNLWSPLYPHGKGKTAKEGLHKENCTETHMYITHFHGVHFVMYSTVQLLYFTISFIDS